MEQTHLYPKTKRTQQEAKASCSRTFGSANELPVLYLYVIHTTPGIPPQTPLQYPILVQENEESCSDWKMPWD